MSAAQFFDDNGTLRLGGTLTSDGLTGDPNLTITGADVTGAGNAGGSVTILGGDADTEQGGSIVIRPGHGADGDGSLLVEYGDDGSTAISTGVTFVALLSGNGAVELNVTNSGVEITGSLDATSLGSSPAYVTDTAAPPTSYVTPLVYDHTAVTGGCYAWTGIAYLKVSNVVA